jgi:hypothetical protein
MVQDLSLSKLLGLEFRQGGAPMQPYHTITMIYNTQQSKSFTSILMLDQDFKAYPHCIC